jgi:dUTP pyrophosphatase
MAQLMHNLVYDVNFKKLNENAKVPTYGSWDAGCCDLYAATDRPIAIAPHTTEKIGTGLAFELPRGTFAAIFARSGIATKRGLRPANCVGICDSDYRGEYIVALHNDTDFVQYVQPQERIAQMTLLPYIYMNFYKVEELSDTERGEGGFGSTGEK